MFDDAVLAWFDCDGPYGASRLGCARYRKARIRALRLDGCKPGIVVVDTYSGGVIANTAFLCPGSDRCGEKAARRIRMQWNVSEDDPRAVLVSPRVLGEKARVGLHVVVEKEQDLPARDFGAPVPGSRSALIGLLDHS